MVGSTRPIKVDVRILASTNKDLAGLVKKGLFREDLFFRINVITIEIPPLRERGDDILLLTQYFTNKFAEELGKPTLRFTDNALQVLKNYHWPGNVRELENVIQRPVVMTDESLIEVPDLPSLMRFSVLRETGFYRTLAEVEAEYIRNVLASVGGNKTKAAEILGIDRKTLREKLNKVDKKFLLNSICINGKASEGGFLGTLRESKNITSGELQRGRGTTVLIRLGLPLLSPSASRRQVEAFPKAHCVRMISLCNIKVDSRPGKFSPMVQIASVKLRPSDQSFPYITLCFLGVLTLLNLLISFHISHL